MHHRPAADPTRHVLRWLLIAAACVLALAAIRALLAEPHRLVRRAPHALVREQLGEVPRRSPQRRPSPHPLQFQPLRLVDAFQLPRVSADMGAPAPISSALAPPLPTSEALVLLALLLAPAVLGRELGRPRAPPIPG